MYKDNNNESFECEAQGEGASPLMHLPGCAMFRSPSPWIAGWRNISPPIHGKVVITRRKK